MSLRQERDVTYLGHVVSSKEIAADLSKVQQVAQWPEPTSQKDVQRFLGFVSYYWRFIKDFAEIAKPLHHLTEKSTVFKWTEECAAAFKALRLNRFHHQSLHFLTTRGNLSWILMRVIQGLDVCCHRYMRMAQSMSLRMEAEYCLSQKEIIV